MDKETLMRRRIYGVVAAASALTLLTGGLAHADNVVNDVVVVATTRSPPVGPPWSATRSTRQV
jgi:hypothetical protein